MKNKKKTNKICLLSNYLLKSQSRCQGYFSEKNIYSEWERQQHDDGRQTHDI
jgi:hypothetical protein